MKPKKCKNKLCGKMFIPDRPLQYVCDWKCAGEHAAALREKKTAEDAKKELKNAKKRIKSRSEWIKDAQQAVNAYIRSRDNGLPCISCGRPTKAGDHAGHWKPTSSSPELRFHEDNIHLQCVQCNLHLHGNGVAYREGLISRIGIDRVERLEAKHEPKKWTIDQLKEIKRIYKEKLKALLTST